MFLVNSVDFRRIARAKCLKRLAAGVVSWVLSIGPWTSLYRSICPATLLPLWVTLPKTGQWCDKSGKKKKVMRKFMPNVEEKKCLIGILFLKKSAGTLKASSWRGNVSH